MKDIGAVHDLKRFTHVVVGDEDTDPARLEVMDKGTDVAHRNRVDPGEGFVKEQVFRFRRKAAGNLHPPPLAARQRQRGGAAQMGDGEFGQQFLKLLAPLVAVGFVDFQHGEDVVLDRQPAKDRHFLRQIADPQTGAAVHRQAGHVLPVDDDMAAVGGNQPGDVVKAGRLARTVGAEKRHHLPPREVERDIADHRTLAIALAQVFDLQPGRAPGDGQDGTGGHHCDPLGEIIVRTRPSIWPVPVFRSTLSFWPAMVPPFWVRRTSPVITTCPFATV